MAFLDNIFIDLTQFEFHEDEKHSLGKGSYGFCYLITDKNKNQLCAKISITPYDAKLQEYLLREVVILKNMKHQSILEFKGFNLYDFRGDSRPTIITDYMPNGSLDKIIMKSNAQKKWNFTKKQICIIGIASAMRYLHRRHIMHRDLKPANVLLDKNYYPKVCDFGLARNTQNPENKDQKDDEKTKKVGTELYMAPEILNRETNYTEKVDVFSFAILAYEISTGHKPYGHLYKPGYHLSSFEFKKCVLEHNERPRFDGFDINPNFQKLIESCWDRIPSKRPSFDVIFDHLIDSSEYLINDQVASTESESKELKEYIESLQDDFNLKGKAKLSIDTEIVSKEKYTQSNETVPNDERKRIEMFNNYMQNGFTGDPNTSMILFTKMLSSIKANPDPTNFVKITYFANKYSEKYVSNKGDKKEGNPSFEFLQNAFGNEICSGKEILSFLDIRDKKVKQINVSPTVKIIKELSFSDLRQLTYVNLPPSITSIEKNAFKGCRNLIWINLNNQITEIRLGTFEDCHSLKYVEFPSTLHYIRKDAFKKCISLDSIHIPLSVKVIEQNAFYGCKSLRMVYVGPTTEYGRTNVFPLRTQVIMCGSH